MALDPSNSSNLEQLALKGLRWARLHPAQLKMDRPSAERTPSRRLASISRSWNGEYIHDIESHLSVDCVHRLRILKIPEIYQF